MRLKFNWHNVNKADILSPVGSVHRTFELHLTLMPSLCPQLMASSSFLMPQRDLTTRFCFVCFDGAEALAAVKAGETLDDSFLEKHCSDLLAGVRRLQAWVRANSA